MRKISDIDRIDEIFGRVGPDEAARLLERAGIWVKARALKTGAFTEQPKRTRRKADQPALPLEAAK